MNENEKFIKLKETFPFIKSKYIHEIKAYNFIIQNFKNPLNIKREDIKFLFYFLYENSIYSLYNSIDSFFDSSLGYGFNKILSIIEKQIKTNGNIIHNQIIPPFNNEMCIKCDNLKYVDCIKEKQCYIIKHEIKKEDIQKSITKFNDVKNKFKKEIDYIRSCRNTYIAHLGSDPSNNFNECFKHIKIIEYDNINNLTKEIIDLMNDVCYFIEIEKHHNEYNDFNLITLYKFLKSDNFENSYINYIKNERNSSNPSQTNC